VDFLKSFAPEPEGEALREREFAQVLGRETAISGEMRCPPEPMLLLERQKERQAEEEAARTAPEASGGNPSVEAASPASSGANGSASNIPAALLPSKDGVEAQRAWITEKTDDLKGQMNLVAAYQEEKVHTTLASISQETSRARKLLRNVQTMRLFLGVHRLRRGLPRQLLLRG
jgi:hypothetical protein